jgi:hypothetical protein
MCIQFSLPFPGGDLVLTLACSIANVVHQYSTWLLTGTTSDFLSFTCTRNPLVCYRADSYDPICCNPNSWIQVSLNPSVVRNSVFYFSISFFHNSIT